MAPFKRARREDKDSDSDESVRSNAENGKVGLLSPFHTIHEADELSSCGKRLARKAKNRTLPPFTKRLPAHPTSQAPSTKLIEMPASNISRMSTFWTSAHKYASKVAAVQSATIGQLRTLLSSLSLWSTL